MFEFHRIAAGATLLAAALAVQAAPVPGQGTWESSLQARDLDGNGQVDAYYDTALNITWLRDANVNGQRDWNAASGWADDLVFAGYSDWRLPTMLDTGAEGCDQSFSGSDCGYNVQTRSGATVFSEMAHLFYETLGNAAAFDTAGNPQAGGLTNTGDFLNMQAAAYWIGLTYRNPETGEAWYFNADDGFQFHIGKENEFFAMAVRAGDVIQAVPEPQSLALVLLALAATAPLTRRRA
ncbi:hypothetical protein [Aquabacterium sp.]|uniref:hypothetical protein n=1 Tax=Aquabacterium sp. TaxID=1872578 RepID=UPI002BE6EFA6|nr:hypothetical protein [Aquabacterium sp.]HSW03418.1 hypothetical protein [Aquabacterium sp.]